MDISVSGHHIQVTQSIREYINKRLRKIENHFQQAASVDVIMHKENTAYQLEATIHGRKMSIHASASSPDVFAAIDSLVSKLDRQVLKYKERLTSHSRDSHRYQMPPDLT